MIAADTLPEIPPFENDVVFEDVGTGHCRGAEVMLQLLRFYSKIGRQLIRPDGVYLECAVIVSAVFVLFFYSRFSAFSQPQGEESTERNVINLCCFNHAGWQRD
uniref:hypothetical protein n=1 Tax=Salmonella enterica TaxID=28901 RepID=UPI00155D9269|nr:hypothetical protein [Salmonella enterica]